MGSAPSTPTTPLTPANGPPAAAFSPFRDKFEAKDEARNERLRSSNTVKNVSIPLEQILPAPAAPAHLSTLPLLPSSPPVHPFHPTPFPPPPVVSPLPASQRIWSEWQKQCLKKCDTDVKRFWVCREENGLLSPFRCTAENEAMKLALQTCGRDEVGFAAFRAKRVDEIEKDILARAALRELKAAEGSKG